jgi:Protein of unknown function (DUF4229)
VVRRPVAGPTYGDGVSDSPDPVRDPAATPEPMPEQGPESAPEPEPASSEVGQPGPPDGHPVVVYTLLRFLLVALVGGVLYLAGVRGIWLILFAFLISGVISVVALNRRREVAAVGVTTAIQRVNARIDAGSRAEDEPADDDLAEYGAAPGAVSSAEPAGDPVAGEPEDRPRP